MRALLDRPATLPIAGALLAVVHLLLSLSGIVSGDRLAGGLLIALGLALAGFLPALAPSLVAVGAIDGGGLVLAGLPIDAVVAGLVVLWSTARRLGPWTRSLTLAGALLLAGVGGIVVALEISGPVDFASSGRVELVVHAAIGFAVALLLAAGHVGVWLAGLRTPVGPDDRIDALLTRVAGPQDRFAVGAAGWQALLLLAVTTVPYTAEDRSLHPVVGGVLAVALVLHRRSPSLALAIAWLGALLQMTFQLSPSPADLAIFAALFGTGASDSRRVRAAGAVSAVLGAVIATAYLGIVFGLLDNSVNGMLTAGATFGGILATLGLSWTVGLLSRSVRRAREGQRLRDEAESERARAQRELDAVEERNRIARDMHDVVAHSLAVVIAQADGARYLGAASPAQTDAALLTISTVARDALADVRVLLAQLRHSQSDGPQPEARDLPALLDSVAGAGGPVRTEIEVDLESVPRATGLALYRIAQEATTNALRHGRPSSPLDVTLRVDSDALVLTVRNARCLDAEAASAPGEGHGLVGMRERAALVGGELSAGPVGDDFVVDARLPAVSSSTSPLIALPAAPEGTPA